MCSVRNWLVEYTVPGYTAIHRVSFASRDKADQFIEGLPDSYIAVAYPVSEDGRPVFDCLSNFNIQK